MHISLIRKIATHNWTITVIGGFIGGALSTVAAGVFLYSRYEAQVEKEKKNVTLTQIHSADSLLIDEQYANALSLYIEASGNVSQVEERDVFVELRYNKGRCYLGLADQEDEEVNLNLSIRSYKEALQYIDPRNQTEFCGKLHTALAGAYWQLSQVRNRRENNRLARFEAVEALRLLSASTDKADFGRAQHAIGNSFLAQSEYEADNKILLDSARAAFEEALKWRSETTSPEDSTSTLINLGVTYCSLSLAENRLRNLQESHDYLIRALRATKAEKKPYDYAVIQTNLGVVYYQLATITDTATNLQNSIMAYKNALEIYRPGTRPINYAKAEMDLGMSFLQLAKLVDTVTNLDLGLASLTESAAYFKLESYPYCYAMVQENLGLLYWHLAMRKDVNENFMKALESYRRALIVYTEEEFPARHHEDSTYISQIQLNIDRSPSNK